MANKIIIGNDVMGRISLPCVCLWGGDARVPSPDHSRINSSTELRNNIQK